MNCKLCEGELIVQFSGEYSIEKANDLAAFNEAFIATVVCKQCGATDRETGYIIGGQLSRLPKGWELIPCEER